MLVYSSVVTARFNYISELILKDLLGIEFQITQDIEFYRSSDAPKLCYNNRHIAEKECLIVSFGLMSERGVSSQRINLIDFSGTKAMFPIYTRESCLPFDIFSAAFYLVSRYEEYLPYMRDEHGRFSAMSSLAWQKDFLQKPVINIWANALGSILSTLYPLLKLKKPHYRFVPTIDIDAAWAFKSKGFYRSIGGFYKDIASLDKDGFITRWKVLIGKEKDPFDTYELMLQLHKKHNLKAVYFILFADYNEFDKNTPVNNTSFQDLVKSLADEGEIGIHPSYASNKNEKLLFREISGLSNVVHKEVTASRQHFLKLHLPDTYRNLIAQDITDDYTMGFAAQPGFRAGICTTFKWYDIEMERSTALRVHPFAIMDGTLRDYMKVEAEGAMLHIKPLINEVKAVGGTFISLFHNESLSEWRRWKGWVKVYEDMLTEGTSL